MRVKTELCLIVFDPTGHSRGATRYPSSYPAGTRRAVKATKQGACWLSFAKHVLETRDGKVWRAVSWSKIYLWVWAHLIRRVLRDADRNRRGDRNSAFLARGCVTTKSIAEPAEWHRRNFGYMRSGERAATSQRSALLRESGMAIDIHGLARASSIMRAFALRSASASPRPRTEDYSTC
jgi:hypothetical protein